MCVRVYLYVVMYTLVIYCFYLYFFFLFMSHSLNIYYENGPNCFTWLLIRFEKCCVNNDVLIILIFMKLQVKDK